MNMSAAEHERAQAASSSHTPSKAASAQHPQEINGAEILVRCLQAEGVKHIWGYPGGAVLYIYDALYQ
ncbi:MAG: acetolactate synthase 3 large subunit, partial [Burkholderiaceae bacterium]